MLNAEYDAFGYPKGTQVDRFEEALHVIAALLREAHDIEGVPSRFRTPSSCRCPSAGCRS